MKKIHCFTESQAGGGAEHQMNILAGLLAENGYDVTLVTYAGLPDHYTVPNNVKRVEVGQSHNSLITFLRTFWYFLWVKTDGVISYRVACNARVLVPMLFRPWTKVIACERNYTVGRPTKFGKFVRDFLYYRADAIIPNSFSQEKYLESLNRSWKNKVQTIINYTDVDGFDVSSIPNEDEVIRFCVFARFSKQKNPLGLVSAIKILKEKSVKPFEFHWYGAQNGNVNGFNQEYLAVKKAVEDTGVEDVFIMHPATKNVIVEMEQYQAVCLPSFYEGFSNSISEGICCGRPMLVSDVSDNAMMVHEGENGFLFDPNDTDSIVNAFERFFALGQEQMEEMGKKSRAIAEQLFDKRVFVESYINLIEKP